MVAWDFKGFSLSVYRGEHDIVHGITLIVCGCVSHALHMVQYVIDPHIPIILTSARINGIPLDNVERFRVLDGAGDGIRKGFSA